MSVVPPQYRTVKTTGAPEERVQWGPDPIGMRQQLAVLASKLRDPQFAFLFNPGDWTPALDGAVAKDLDAMLKDWIGADSPIAILDLSESVRRIVHEFQARANLLIMMRIIARIVNAAWVRA